jgi:STE24 endopeptidase
MNVYAIVILAAFLVEHGIGLTADVLNLRALDPEVPAEFRDVYDAERYRRSQAYTRARTRLGIVSGTVGLAAFLAFWLAGGFPWLDGRVRALGLGAIPTGLLFVAALGLLRLAVGLPFAIWSTFVVEERFGFNKTTPRTFVLDLAKGLVLAVLLGGPLLAAVLWLFQRAGDAAWLWCWGMATLYLLFVQFVAPTWILPLFNRFEPLREGDLRERILAYARSVSFPVEGLFVIDGSRRSTKANAFFTGFGRRKRIALFDTLVEKHEPEEVVAVVAHEIGHYKRHHVLLGLAISIAHAGLLFFLLSLFLDERGLYAAFGIDGTPIHAGLVFFGLLYAPIELVLGPLVQAFSRRNEYEADRWAKETTGTGERLARALKRLSADSLSNLTPHPFYVLLHYSHPPVLRRIEALRAGV